MDNRPHSAAIEGIPHFTLTRRHGTNDCRCIYECDELNARGERLVVELLDCGWVGNMAREWFRRGRTDHLLEHYWGFNTYVYEGSGCYGRYNPTEMTYKSKPDTEGHVSVRPVIDFEWMLDATRDNALALFAETYRRFMACESRKVVGDEYMRR